MQFKPGDKVRRHSDYQHFNGWPWGGEVREVESVQNFGRDLVLKDSGEHYSCWAARCFERDTGPNGAQKAATAKFDGQPQPTPAEAVKLKGDLKRVHDVLAKADSWWSLKDIARVTGVSEISVGSRVRDLRKVKFGGYNIERLKSDGPRNYVYRMVSA